MTRIHDPPPVGHLFSGRIKSNRQGTRIFGGKNKGPLTIIDIPYFTTAGTAAATTGQFHLSAQGHFVPSFDRNTFCFAGRYDDLVASASADYNLYVWPLPEGQGNEITVNQSLLELRGHAALVLAAQYDHCHDVLASAEIDKMIKLWTPLAQQ